ncbi:MAG: hypothetical protein K2X90_00390 [Candidatus Babeliaceae bacterium]|nr:hypothetical protein [Candidatus Babeliaceae bacterium]
MNLKKALLVVLLSTSSRIYCLENTAELPSVETQVSLRDFLQGSQTPPPTYSPPPVYTEPSINPHGTLPSYAQATAHTRSVKKCDYIILAVTGLLSVCGTTGGVYFFRTSASDGADPSLPLIAGMAIGAGAFGMGISIIGSYIKCIHDRHRIDQINASMNSELYAYTV